MVKRQTVWLSTMMVLSLMLIGYYTMNNGGQQAATSNDNGPMVSTAVEPAPSGSQTGAAHAPQTSPAQGTGTKATQAATATTPANAKSTSAQTTSGVPNESVSDWFINYQNQVEQNLSQKEDMYQSILTNNNASTEQIARAEQELQQLHNLEGGMADAMDAIKGEGYKNCVIVPNVDGNSVTVYVQAPKGLTADQAVQIMNIVSRQMNVPINHVYVNWK
ncbi:stage III sporulation protein AH [Alicyclobacillus cellulosilyticus]|uniref:Stage III sporulation protein AH n=1 Tax=Alicyclobacillus cellulosilyticus TaxID=1003997 RepID=A0A917K329_9BACL|nr:SpoIIIAH-like family protein [Alicyclobacillus cellulosilyticus]GGI95956.1 stage III sporulation protein AH [Alicyclobacillus cellulosilyticus]